MKMGTIIGAALVAGLLALAAGFYIASLRSELETVNTRLGQAEKGISARDGVITQLREKQAAQALLQARLEGERSGIQSVLATRETLIRKLEIENAEYRAWAAGPLPGSVSRLREHPELVGAAAYRERMSQGAALPAAGSVNGK